VHTLAPTTQAVKNNLQDSSVIASKHAQSVSNNFLHTSISSVCDLSFPATSPEVAIKFLSPVLIIPQAYFPGKDSTEEGINDEPEEENSKGGWSRADFLLTTAGKHPHAIEFLQGGVWYGGIRERGEKPLGRASKDTSPEKRAENARITRRRNKKDVQDTINQNEGLWTAFDSFSCGDICRNVEKFLDKIKNYRKRVVRAVRKHFNLPDFEYQYAGGYALQDGERRKDRNGRMSLHLHETNNLPFWKVKVIVGLLRDPACPDEKPLEHYLLEDGSWSLWPAGKTRCFDNVQSVKKFLRTERKNLLADPRVVDVFSKPVPMYAVLWGEGFCWRRWFCEGDDIDDKGGYVAGHYLCDNLDQEVAAGKLTQEEVDLFIKSSHKRKGWLHSEFETDKDGNVKKPGGLQRPGKLRGEAAKDYLIEHHAWDCLVSARSFKPEKVEGSDYEMGWLVSYKFNLNALEKNVVTLPLYNRAALSLDPELEDYVTAYDLECWRREKPVVAEISPPVLSPPVLSPQVCQADLFPDTIHADHWWLN
jgi:hypothetical protein